MTTKADLQIDKNALDEELLRQPQLFFEASEAYANTVSLRDEAKEKLNLVDASLSKKIRMSWDEDKEKIAEWKVTERIRHKGRHKRARHRYLVLKQQADIALALKEAFQQRSYVLKDLASLWVAGYYTTASVRGGTAEDVRNAAAGRNRRRMKDSRRKLRG